MDVDDIESVLAECGIDAEPWQIQRLTEFWTGRHDLSASVLRSFGQMPWLTAADEAAKGLALTYAARIDESLEHDSGPEVTKALYLGPHLLKALESLGGSPLGRKQASSPTTGKEGPRGKLELLRQQEADRRGKSA